MVLKEIIQIYRKCYGITKQSATEIAVFTDMIYAQHPLDIFRFPSQQRRGQVEQFVMCFYHFLFNGLAKMRSCLPKRQGRRVNVVQLLLCAVFICAILFFLNTSIIVSVYQFGELQLHFVLPNPRLHQGHQQLCRHHVRHIVMPIKCLPKHGLHFS